MILGKDIKISDTKKSHDESEKGKRIICGWVLEITPEAA